MIEVLVRILIDQLCFLELSGDDVVNPDDAVRQMDGIVAELNSLSVDDRERLATLIRAEAAKQKVAGESKRTEFIESIPEGFGLEDEDP